MGRFEAQRATKFGRKVDPWNPHLPRGQALLEALRPFALPFPELPRSGFWYVKEKAPDPKKTTLSLYSVGPDGAEGQLLGTCEVDQVNWNGGGIVIDGLTTLVDTHKKPTYRLAPLEDLTDEELAEAYHLAKEYNLLAHAEAMRSLIKWRDRKRRKLRHIVVDWGWGT